MVNLDIVTDNIPVKTKKYDRTQAEKQRAGIDPEKGLLKKYPAIVINVHQLEQHNTADHNIDQLGKDQRIGIELPKSFQQSDIQQQESDYQETNDLVHFPHPFVHYQHAVKEVQQKGFIHQ
jgi:hypothetical protein